MDSGFIKKLNPFTNKEIVRELLKNYMQVILRKITEYLCCIFKQESTVNVEVFAEQNKKKEN